MQENKNSPTKFVDGGKAKRTQFIHRVGKFLNVMNNGFVTLKYFFVSFLNLLLSCLKVTLRNLTENTRYKYHCGSDLGWSDLYWFDTLSANENWSPSLAIFGDLGNENAQSLPRLQEETQAGLYDVILHVGDFAYDMNSQDGIVGDEFMRQISAVAAYAPYMVVPGNHEVA